MKQLILLLILATSACLANNSQSRIIDSIGTTVKNLDERVDSLNKKFLSDNFISINAAKETQVLHNAAFDKMQNSFSTFVYQISIIVALVGVFIVLLSYYNFRTNDKLKDELAKIKNFESKIKDLEDRSEYMTALQHSTDFLLGIQGKHHYLFAKTALKDNKFLKHFEHVSAVFYCFMRVQLKECNVEKILEYLKNNNNEFLGMYKEKLEDEAIAEQLKKDVYNINNSFVESLLEFIKCGEDSGNIEHSEEAKSMYNKFCDLFDYNKIKNGLKEYLRNNKRNKMREILSLAEKYRDKR
ncbi:MAG: hypothetical protein FWB90_00775 [Fibromonadales bacterium]|nr:hypothetical protein [Fibromonadales bacterium]